MAEASPRILFYGPLPPPVSGMPVVNQQMVDALASRAPLQVIDTLPEAPRRSLHYHFGKLAAMARALATLARPGELRAFYASADDGWGGLWNIAPLWLARSNGLGITLHHHSFRYIERPSAIMTAIIDAAGPDCRHVMLCEEMQRRFASLYPAARQFLIVGNRVDEPIGGGARARPESAPLTIGLLSNLTFEKGLDDFIALVERNPGVHGLLAGPAAGREATLIREKCAALGDRLRWLGPVSGEAKEAFFAAIDLFVLPTRYPTETLPLVLEEALVRGVPVAAPARGCICLFAGLQAATIVPLNEDFMAVAAALIKRLADDPARARQLSATAREEGRAINRAHEEAHARLADDIAREAAA